MSRHVSVGVIGHVDHGKTSLVKALTGMDTDRLPEEKARGMSIALGFAWIEFDDGCMDLIDVPGHENFVRTMVGGASGMEACLLVVDAHEGVRQQTKEHLAIAQLLGIRKGVVALTKCDRLPLEQRRRALGALTGYLRHTCLAQAPVVFTSSVTGEGLEELRLRLHQLLQAHAAAAPGDRFYLPIDRVFSLPGSGTVVTGTLRHGCLAVGDEVDIGPLGIRSAVRQLEHHGAKVERAGPGQRVGVNLRQVKADMLARGLMLASPGWIQPSMLLDAQLILLKESDRPLQHGQRVRLLFGATEVLACVRLLEEASLAPGASAFAQLRLQKPVAAVSAMPFIIRSESPAMTIGGGRILDAMAKRCRRNDSSALDRLRLLAHGAPAQIVQERLKQAGYAGASLAQLSTLSGQGTEQLRKNLEVCDATWLDAAQLIYTPFLDTLGDMCVAALRKFHHHHPGRKAAPLAYCRAALPRSVGDRVFKQVLHRLEAAKHIEVEGGLVCLFGWDPLSALDPDARHLAASMEEALRRGGMMPPDVDELAKDEAGMELLHLLAARGDAILLPGEQPGKKIVFHREAVEAAQRCMAHAFPWPAAFTVSEFRMLIGSTRKFAVPLLAYFDSLGITQRQGDKRVIRVSSRETNGVW